MAAKSKPVRGDSAIAFEFLNQISIISQLATTVMERQLPLGLTLSQFSVLNWFTRVDQQANPGRLARAFEVTGGAMTNTLRKLEGKGLVRIVPDPASGRQKIVTITGAGRRARERAVRCVGADLEGLIGVLPAKEIRTALPVLEATRRYLDGSRSTAA